MLKNSSAVWSWALACLLLTPALWGCQGEDFEGIGSNVNFADTSKAESTPNSDGAPGCVEGLDENDPCLFCSCTEEGERQCAPLEVGNPCASANCCLANPTCQPCDEESGECPGSGLICLGSSKLKCNTGDQCSVVTAACLNGECACMQTSLPDNSPCVDNPNACTEGDTCQNGTCEPGANSPLEDENPCTSLVCIKGTVETKLLDGDCSDGNPCTTGDRCSLGQCVPETLMECPQSQCAQSYCDPELGECVSDILANGLSCASGDPCVVLALCKDGMCRPELYRTCNDGDPCTSDGCHPDTGECFHTTISPCTTCTSNAECDDGDTCNGIETCDAVSGCQIGAVPQCNDFDECTEDNCDPAFGCVYSQIEGCGEPPTVECTGSSVELDGFSCIVVENILEEKMGAFTIEFWVNISDPDLQSTLLDKRIASLNDPGFEIRANFLGSYQEKLHYDENRPPKGSASGMFTKSQYTTGEWHHFAVTRSEPEPLAGFATCTSDNECQAGCTATDFQECVCTNSPLGAKDCVPTCTTHSDCPSDGPGKTLACMDGTCRRYKVSFRIFVDGDLNQSSNWQGSYGNLPNDKPLNIGCRGNPETDNLNQFFLGRVEELRISDTLRYSGSFDVASLPFEADASTVALYHFEEGSGTQVMDASGNGHHGNWVGTPLWSPLSPLNCSDTDP